MTKETTPPVATESICFDIEKTDCQAGLEAGEVEVKVKNHAGEWLLMVLKKEQIAALLK